MKVKFSDWCKQNLNIVTQIRNTASKVHADVNQHYDIYPYSYHLQMVFDEFKAMADIVLITNEEYYPSLVFGAYFHDSIEDARLTYNDVKKIALSILSNEDDAIKAAEYAYALTNEKGRNRAERANDKYYEGIRNTPYANRLKLADRLANYRYSHMTQSSMYKKYEAEMSHFLEAIGCTPEMDVYVKKWMNDLKNELV